MIEGYNEGFGIFHCTGNKKHVPFGRLQVNDMSDLSMALTMCGTQRLATVILFRLVSDNDTMPRSEINYYSLQLVLKSLKQWRTYFKNDTIGLYLTNYTTIWPI